jgi:hypothetical protein
MRTWKDMERAGLRHACALIFAIAGQRCQCADPRRQLGQLFRRTYNNGPKSLAEKDRLDPYLIRWRK